ncbi:hypothetical protein [Acrocarpospora sp. B8E8]|uniref:hypothetical protein n=1 Tax=Acrocarpospora sp. B8E8 TaxID=3153572 RepID=UPI00325F07FA
MTSESATHARGRALVLLAGIGVAVAAFLASGAADARVGALPPCGAELPIPGHPGETYEVLCPIQGPPPNDDVPYDFQEPDPDWPWPGPINP